MISSIAVAGLLLGHGLIHAAYLSPRPPATAGGPPWPFELNRSWLLGRLDAGSEVARPLGLALVSATIAGFALATLAALGFAPAAMWTTGVAVGAIASLTTLGLFFHPWLVVGLGIDLVLLWAVLLNGWVPEGLAS